MSPFFLTGLGLSLGCLIAALHFLRRKRLVDDTPTSKTLGVFIGMAELKGTVESDAPLTSYLAQVQCVHYTWHVAEHWSRNVTETYTDSKGTHTRTRHESGWTTVAKGGDTIPFYLKDAAGIIRIAPQGAKIEDQEVCDKTIGRSDPLYYTKGPADAVANSDFQRRFVETALVLHTPIYVMGQARERQDVVAAEIASDKKSPVFLISTRTEKQITSGFAVWFWVWLWVGLLAALGGALLTNTVQPIAIAARPQLLAAAIAGYVVAFGIGWGWTVYNSLINLRLRVRQGWAQMYVQIKRRHDLIPNLVEVVEGYASHEKDLQTLVTQLRDQIATNAVITGCAPLLKVAMENYPSLKAGELFLMLQQELSATEERIALARDYCNDVATHYNTRLEVFPDTVLAKLMKLRSQPLLTTTDFERAPLQVNLIS